MTACAPVFEHFIFSEGEENRMLRYAIIGSIAEYLEGEPKDHQAVQDKDIMHTSSVIAPPFHAKGLTSRIHR